MTFLCVDIETIPQAKYLVPALYDLAISRTPLLPAKIQLDRHWVTETLTDHGPDYPAWMTWAQQAIARGEAVLDGTGVAPALHPTTCHIVQVSYAWRSADRSIKHRIFQFDDFLGDGVTVTDTEAWEKPLLDGALDLLASAAQKDSTIVSFNGKQFDLPVMRWRAALLGLRRRLPWRGLLYPYDETDHADLRLMFSSGDRRARGTLQWWSDAMGIKAEEHGADVLTWFQTGEWRKLRQYGETEGVTLVEQYERSIGLSPESP